MAKLFMLDRQPAGASNFLSLKEIGPIAPDPPEGGMLSGSGLTITTTTGWTVGTTAAGNYALMAAGTERAAATFSTTIQPRTSPDNILGDCFRTLDPLNLSFPVGSWTLDFYVSALTSGSNQDGRVRWRLWKGTLPDGSDAVEITTKPVINSILTNIAVNAATSNSTGSVTMPAIIFRNEFLFLQIAWEITGAGSLATKDVLFRIQKGLQVLTAPDPVDQVSTSEFCWYTEKAILDQWFGNVAPTIPSKYYIGIAESNPTDDGIAPVDIVGRYRRYPVDNNLLNWVDVSMLGHEMDGDVLSLYRFDEPSGPLVDDETGNYFGDASGSPPRVVGVRKRAMEYDVTQYTETDILALADRTAMQGACSVEMCVYIKSTLVTNTYLFTAGGSADDPSAFNNNALMILLASATTDAISIGWERGDPPGNYNTGPLGTITRDVWQHIAVTRSAGGEVKLYINGQMTGSFTMPNLPDFGGGMFFHFPGLPSATPLGIKGYLDEIRVSTVERTPGEIQDSYQRCFVQSTGRAIVQNDKDIMYQFLENSGINVSCIFVSDAQIDGRVLAWCEITPIVLSHGEYFKIPAGTLNIHLG